jgi:hypothetical protein
MRLLYFKQVISKKKLFKKLNLNAERNKNSRTVSSL